MAPNMKGIFQNFPLKQLSPYIAFIVIFVHNIVLGHDLPCSCGNQKWECVLYMVLPSLILFFLQLWTDKTLQRTWKYTSRNCKCKFFLNLLYHLIRAAVISLLWVVAVYIDGDWYVCCQNSESTKHPDLACKDKQKNITLEERKRIAELKGQSLVIGLWTVLGALLAATLMSLFRWMKCCIKCSGCCRKLDYYKVILKEEENVLKEVLTTAAKKTLTEGIEKKILSDKWTDCFDVAEKMIDNNKPPVAAESEERKLQLEKLGLEETLQLEKLKLEVQRLRGEEQTLEPDPAEQRAAATRGARGGTTTGRAAQGEDMELLRKQTEVHPLMSAP